MIKLYNILNKSCKADIKGLWLNNGKIYFDKIKIVYIKDKDIKWLNYYRQRLFTELNQLAVFYIKDNWQGIIEDRQGNKTILNNNVQFKIKKISHNYIKDLLRKYNGLTIFRLKNNYLIDIWYN